MLAADSRARSLSSLLRIVVWLVLTVGLLGTPASAGAAPTVTITDLGPGEATAINNAGQIVINTVVDRATELTHAFVWQAGQRTNLGTLGGSTFGQGINDAGQVAGYSSVPNSGLHAFIWQNGTLTDIAPQYTSSVANDINKHGHVVGYRIGERLSDRDGQRISFVWRNGNLTDLNPLPGDVHSEAIAINVYGDIVGTSYPVRGPNRSVRWKDGVPSNVGQFDDNYATDINDYGVIAGNFQASRPNGAFTWDNGAFTELLVIDNDTNSRVNAINNYGQAVGLHTAPAALWQAGTLIDLGSMGGYTSVNDINERGQIVGTSNGRAILWTINPPQPEPGSNVNPGFEDDQNYDGRTDSWTVSNYASMTTTGEYSGLSGLRLKASGNRDFRVYQAVYGLRPGTTFDVRGVVNIPPTSDTFQFSIVVSWKDKADKEVRLDTVKTFTGRTNGWTDAKKTLVAPPGTDHAVLRLQVTSLSATIFVDEVYFQPH